MFVNWYFELINMSDYLNVVMSLKYETIVVIELGKTTMTTKRKSPIEIIFTFPTTPRRQTTKCTNITFIWCQRGSARYRLSKSHHHVLDGWSLLESDARRTRHHESPLAHPQRWDLGMRSLPLGLITAGTFLVLGSNLINEKSCRNLH